MAVNVKVHHPAGTDVKVYLNGAECSEIETDGQPVSVIIEQTPKGTEGGRSERLKLYYASVFGRKLRYGTDVPSPFRARFSGTLKPGTEGTVSFTLACMEGRYRIVPEGNCFIKGSVQSMEINDDSGLFKIVLGTVLIPLLIIFSLAFAALYKPDVPTVARIGFGIVYAVIIAGALFVFFEKTRRKRYYPEENE